MTITPNPVEPYVYQEYPKWKYHPDKEGVIVDNYEAEKALGADWYDSPQEAKAAVEKLRQGLASVRENLIKEGIVTPHDSR